MDVLNLDNEFNPFKETISYDSFIFSGGEVHIKLKKEAVKDVLISCRLNTSNDVINLLMATDALKRIGAKKIDVLIPYLPYARQDRVMVKGEPLSIKVFCDLINSQNYNKVLTYDLHSEVSSALLNNLDHIDNYGLVMQTIEPDDDFMLVSPDAGAMKKIYNLAKYIGYNKEVVCAEKVRNVETGDILRTHVPFDDFGGKDILIVDDICDGGRTFIELAKILKSKNCGKICLFITHGIFSKGLDVLLEHIDHIYTTDSIKNWKHDKLTKIKIG